jgi:hypothetical protein
MRAAHLRQRTLVRVPDPMPDLRHDPYRARGSSASGGRCARSQIARPSTSGVPRPQAFGRGDPGRAFDCPRSDPNQATCGASSAKQQPAAEICCLCHRVGRAGGGRLPLRAFPAEQDTGQHEFHTDPSYSRPQQRWSWPLGRSKRRHGRLGHAGRRLLITTAPGHSPTASGRPNAKGPRCQSRGRIYE